MIVLILKAYNSNIYGDSCDNNNIDCSDCCCTIMNVVVIIVMMLIIRDEMMIFCYDSDDVERLR